MLKIDDFNLVLDYLNDKAIVTTNGKNEFYLEGKKIVMRFNGSMVKMDMKDFVDLYRNNNFYLMEEEIVVDETKDEDYYRYYRK